jgi:hypothetical protein
MKKRILTGWTIRRGLYLVLGIVILIKSVMEQQWLAALAGGYFISMGVFAFGCAAGNCFGRTCHNQAQQQTNTKVQDVEFEEVKQK